MAMRPLIAQSLGLPRLGPVPLLATSGWTPPIHPEFRRLPDPVIVIGMHRSGTSLVAAMLGALGVYMGPELEELLRRPAALYDHGSSGYGESAAFFRLNERLLRRSGSTWSRVEPLIRRRRDPTFHAGSVLALASATWGSLRGSLPVDPGSRRPAEWGWKDPRNSLTLPYWLALFPRARVVHVARNAFDVAESLHRRACRWQESGLGPGGSAARGGRAVTIRALARRLGLAADPRPDPCLDREYCLHLAQLYLEECLRYTRLGGYYQEVRYEEILRDPSGAALGLSRFAGLRPDAVAVERAAQLVRVPASPLRVRGTD